MTLEELLDFSSCVHYLEGPHVFVEALEHMSNWNKFSLYLYGRDTDVATCKLYLAAEALSSKREYVLTRIMARVLSIGEFDFLENTPLEPNTFKPFLVSRYTVLQALQAFEADPEHELVNVTKMYAVEHAKGTNARHDILGRLQAKLKRIYKAKLYDCAKNMQQTLIQHKERKNENTENLPG